ncbi:hypothetical protein ATKI12_1685 [Kitasatospora sp. Ki12]
MVGARVGVLGPGEAVLGCHSPIIGRPLSRRRHLVGIQSSGASAGRPRKVRFVPARYGLVSSGRAAFVLVRLRSVSGRGPSGCRPGPAPDAGRRPDGAGRRQRV